MPLKNHKKSDANATVNVAVSHGCKGNSDKSTTLTLQEKDFTPLSLPVQTEARGDEAGGDGYSADSTLLVV